MARQPIAIIDIGSNSVRLVVYGGAERAPSPIFNEKVLAGLGAGLAETGMLGEASQDLALAALRRFHLLLRYMKVGKVRVVATAAVRDARNGAGFVAQIKRIGFDCTVLSAEEEAQLAGEGVLSGIPLADGIVGDLGGGSLELVEVGGGAVKGAISLPLGVLRIAPDASGERQALAILRQALTDSGLGARGRGRSLYMVGGSWRALGKIDMIANGYPLPIMHNYAMKPARAAALRQLVGALDAPFTKAIAAARLATSPIAAMLLEQLADELRPNALVVSGFGIREGLIHDGLRGKARGTDPLIA
ncbi:MAG: Ppx/GppA family phosphatase, partial [Sphingomicrobium sp.]